MDYLGIIKQNYKVKANLVKDKQNELYKYCSLLFESI